MQVAVDIGSEVLFLTTAQVVETSVTNNSLSKGYPHPEDHDKPITDTPGFKPFTNKYILYTYIHINCFYLQTLIQSMARKAPVSVIFTLQN